MRLASQRPSEVTQILLVQAGSPNVWPAARAGERRISSATSTTAAVAGRQSAQLPSISVVGTRQAAMRSAAAARGLLEQPAADSLSVLFDREKGVLELSGEGLTNRQIAERMFLAEKTVKNYVSPLHTKLGMQRRTEAAAFSVRLSANQHP